MKRILHLFNKDNSVRGASIILIITLAISNILGLLRDRYLTKNIDLYNLDIYYAAFRIPDLIFNLLILGAIVSAFIPVFSEFIAHKKEEEGFKVANMLINAGLVFVAVSAIILIIIMPYLMVLVVPKFDHYRMEEAIRLSRLLMLTPIFFSVSYVLGGMLNCFKRFFIYSLSPIVYNLAIIIGAAVLAPKYGIVGVVYAVVAGSFLHLLIIIPSIVKLGYRYKPIISFKDETFLKIVKLMIPRSISMGAGQIMLLVYTAIASALAFGSISAFTLANNIQSVPVMVLGSAFSSAIFPTLAIKIAQKKEKEFAFYLNRALRAIGYFLIPSTFIFILLRAQIVRLLYGSGKFDWSDTRMTALALGFFSLSILAQGLVPLFSRAFYAMKNTKTPMYCSIATVIVSIIIAFPLAKYYSVAGLAIAFTIGSYFNAFTLSYFLNKKYPGVLDKDLFKSYVVTFVISLAMGVAVWSSMHIASLYVDMTRFVGVLSQTIIAIVSGAAVFFTLSYFFDQDEMKWAFSRKINGEANNNENKNE
jgi:putative peptidoglycan lipid II flippase